MIMHRVTDVTEIAKTVQGNNHAVRLRVTIQKEGQPSIGTIKILNQRDQAVLDENKPLIDGTGILEFLVPGQVGRSDTFLADIHFRSEDGETLPRPYTHRIIIPPLTAPAPVRVAPAQPARHDDQRTPRIVPFLKIERQKVADNRYRYSFILSVTRPCS